MIALFLYIFVRSLVMNVVLRSPGIYFQMPGALSYLVKYVSMFGKKALLVSTEEIGRAHV